MFLQMVTAETLRFERREDLVPSVLADTALRRQTGMTSESKKSGLDFVLVLSFTLIFFDWTELTYAWKFRRKS